jgi:ribosomal protein L21
MTKVKIFEKKVKLKGKKSEGQDHGIKWKVLPEVNTYVKYAKVKVLKKKAKNPRSKIRGSRSWYQMKGIRM